MQPFFLSTRNGQRFCLFYPAKDGQSRGAVLYVHPFAEEMNKSRRMAALQARAMAVAGYDVLQMDLLGCGDSDGDFGDASWQSWLDDLLEGYSCLRKRSRAPLTLWGLRAGCLLVSELAVKLPEPVSFVFWQPVVTGKQHWQQFMRLKLAGEIASGGGKDVMEALKRQLESGRGVEIAGYTVSSLLVAGLQKADLTPKGPAGRVSWLEVSSRDEAAVAPVSLRYIAQWEAMGASVDAMVVPGPAFWQTTEIEDAPALISSTLAAIGLQV